MREAGRQHCGAAPIGACRPGSAARSGPGGLQTADRYHLREHLVLLLFWWLLASGLLTGSGWGVPEQPVADGLSGAVQGNGPDDLAGSAVTDRVPAGSANSSPGPSRAGTAGRHSGRPRSWAFQDSATMTFHNNIRLCRGEGYRGAASGAVIGLPGQANLAKEYRTDITMSMISTESQDNLYSQRSETVVAPTLLTPDLVEQMIARRQAVQVIKFRTTCTDCLPNF
jgi:hypothetical protein